MKKLFKKENTQVLIRILGLLLIASIIVAASYIKEQYSTIPDCATLKKNAICTDSLDCDACIEKSHAAQKTLGPGQ